MVKDFIENIRVGSNDFVKGLIGNDETFNRKYLGVRFLKITLQKVLMRKGEHFTDNIDFAQKNIKC